MSADVAPAARTLARQLGDAGWSVKGPRPGSGPCVFSALSEAEDGNGRRKRVEVVEHVESVLIRACHIDGRALVALWMRRPGRGWTLDMAWRGRHGNEYAPARLTATQLKAYVAAADHAAAIAAVTPVGEAA